MSVGVHDRAKEELAQAIDRLDYLAHALLLPMPAQFHVKQLKAELPEVVAELKTGYASAIGKNPWEDEDMIGVDASDAASSEESAEAELL